MVQKQKLPEVVIAHQRFVIYADNGTDEVCTCTIRRLHGKLLIEDVLTDPEYRGQGLASTLIQQVLAQYPHEHLYLQADNEGFDDPPYSNAQLVEFYKRLGFVETDFPGGMVFRVDPPAPAPGGFVNTGRYGPPATNLSSDS